MRNTKIFIMSASMLLFICCNKHHMGHYTINNYKIDSPIPFSFTIYENQKNSDNNTVLYFLHGRGGDDGTWLRSHGDLIRYWEKLKKPIPIVIGVTLGEKWVLVPKNKSDKSGHLEYFLDTIIPHIEKKIHSAIKKRYILGISMGGHNAAQLVFRHPELFNKAAIISPSIYPFSIHSNDEKINQFCIKVREHNSGFRNLINYHIFKKDTICNNIKTMINAQRVHTPDQTSWEINNIIDNMKKPSGATIPSIYISCGDKDEFGFYYGSLELARKALSLSYPVKMSIIKGCHTVMDDKEIAVFFINN